MNNFFRRTVTGAGIVIFILGGFWLHPVTFYLTALVLIGGSLYEYYQIARSNGASPLKTAGIIAGFAAYTVCTLVAANLIHEKYVLLLLVILPAVIIAELYRKQEKPFDSIAHTLVPLLWVVVPFSLMPFSAFSHPGINTIIPALPDFSPGLIIGFFFLVWANDTGAYLVGVTAGKHKLMERISPKKTWEGFAGGLIASAAVSLLLPGFLGITGPSGWIITALIVSVAGTYGDLAESMLKRSSGIKDSGNIMPGHGGFLDRFDSTILAFPLVYLFITLFG